MVRLRAGPQPVPAVVLALVVPAVVLRAAVVRALVVRALVVLALVEAQLRLALWGLVSLPVSQP